MSGHEYNGDMFAEQWSFKARLHCFSSVAEPETTILKRALKEGSTVSSEDADFCILAIHFTMGKGILKEVQISGERTLDNALRVAGVTSASVIELFATPVINGNEMPDLKTNTTDILLEHELERFSA